MYNLADITPEYEAWRPDMSALPASERDQVRKYLEACRLIHKAPAKQTLAVIGECAEHLGVSLQTMRRKYYAWRNNGQDWLSVCNRTRLACKAHNTRTRHPGFRAFVARLIGESQRKHKPAYRRLLRIWQEREEVIPGYEGWPGWPAIPSGWSYKNFLRLVPDTLEVTLMRQGTLAAAPLMEHVLTTRAGLEAGEYIVIDDNWIDALVAVGDQIVRPLQLGCLDLATGKLVHWGMIPRLKQEDGSHQGLSERYMRMLLAGLLANVGYNPDRGTTLIVEHGTAAIRERMEEILTRLFNGKVKVRRSGIVGKEQALLRGFRGRGGGNFKSKTHLESWWNLAHNEWSAILPAPTGHDRTEPEWLHGMREEEQRLLKDAAGLAITDPVRVAMIRHYTTTFEQLGDLAVEVYHRINGRTDHQLEGWERMGLMCLEARLDPGMPWQDVGMIQDERIREQILRMTSADPTRLQRARRLSPAEAWDLMTARQAPLRKATQYEVVDMLSQDLSKEARVHGAYIKVQHQDISRETLYYPATIETPEGYRQTLPDGEQIRVMINTMDPGHLYITDRDGRCLGKALRQQRVALQDEEAVRQAMGRKHQSVARAKQATRINNARKEAELVEQRLYNQGVLNGEPLTLEGQLKRQWDLNDLTPTPIEKREATQRRKAVTQDDIDDLCALPDYEEQDGGSEYATADLSDLY